MTRLIQLLIVICLTSSVRAQTFTIKEFVKFAKKDTLERVQEAQARGFTVNSDTTMVHESGQQTIELYANSSTLIWDYMRVEEGMRDGMPYFWAIENYLKWNPIRFKVYEDCDGVTVIRSKRKGMHMFLFIEECLPIARHHFMVSTK